MTWAHIVAAAAPFVKDIAMNLVCLSGIVKEDKEEEV